MPDNSKEIIIGTYEQFLLGYKITTTTNGQKLNRSFATHSHQASVRDVASSSRYLASAGADDSIYLYDMKSRMESGKLTHHNDTVNNIAFTPDSSHILSCSSDGSIAVVRCGNWQLEKHWKNAHKGSSVNCLAVHPSGKLALSLGGDGVLRTWNLVKGRQAYATNLVPKLGLEARNITVTKWSPDGTKYLIATNFALLLYAVEKAGIVHKAEFKSRVTCVEFLDDDVLVIGHDDGQIEFYDTQSSSQLFSEAAHETRVKTVAHSDGVIVTASSSGELKLWSFDGESISSLATENCGARITCLVLAESFSSIELKKEDDTIKEETPIPRKNVFRIRQEVTVEDEEENDDEKIQNEPPKKPWKKLKRKLNPKTVSTQSLAQSASKKSKFVEEDVITVKRKKKRKLTKNVKG